MATDPDLTGVGTLLLQQPEVAERLMRSLNLKGALPQYLKGRFDASVAVEDLLRPEFAFLRREYRMAAGAAVSAVAAQVSFVGLMPTAAVGVTTARGICTVEKIILCNPSGTAYTVAMGVTAPAIVQARPGSFTGLPLDDRSSRTDAYQLTSQFGLVSGTNVGSPVPGGLFAMQIPVPAGGTVTVDDVGAVLTGARVKATGEDVGFFAVAGTVNLPLIVNFIWRERTAAPSETL